MELYSRGKNTTFISFVHFRFWFLSIDLVWFFIDFALVIAKHLVFLSQKRYSDIG